MAAVGKLPSLDRAQIRHTFERRFTAKRMAEDYLLVYQRLIAIQRPLNRVGLRDLRAHGLSGGKG